MLMEIVQSEQPPCTDWQGRRWNNLGAVCGLTGPVTFSWKDHSLIFAKENRRNWYLYGKQDARAQIPENTSTYSSKLSKVAQTSQIIPPQHHQQTMVVFLHTILLFSYHPKSWVIVLVIYSTFPKPKVPVHLCLWSVQNAQQCEDKCGHPPPTSSISQKQGWLCVWRQARRETGKTVTVINVLPPECDINVCMQCVHNVSYLCTTLINTMFDSSFTKPVSELEEHAMRQSF